MPRPSSDEHPQIPTLATLRTTLLPLEPAHSAEMFAVLDDTELGRFTGDAPPRSVPELRRRYEFLMSRRSPDGSELWWNWMVRLEATGQLVGYIQATVQPVTGSANLGWVIGTRWQGKGIATEASAAVANWLRQAGIRVLKAYVHPQHRASEAVADRIGLKPTEDMVAGERCWRWQRQQ